MTMFSPVAWIDWLLAKPSIASHQQLTGLASNYPTWSSRPCSKRLKPNVKCFSNWIG